MGKKTHQMTKTRLYTIWKDMKQRCYDPNHIAFQRYNGKGVYICEEWLKFENFRDWAFANGYEENLTLDRIDNQDIYKPENCRWTTMKVQGNNRSNNNIVIYQNKQYTVAELADCVGIKYHTLLDRISKWKDIERAVNEPIRQEVDGVNQYDLTGKFIKKWQFIIDTERELGIKAQNISQCCTGKLKTAGGYMWKHSDGCENVEPVQYEDKPKHRGGGKKVGQFDKNNNLIRIWENASIAADELGLKSTNIYSVCNNKPKFNTCGGFIWKYI